jgi:hypothetical protein
VRAMRIKSGVNNVQTSPKDKIMHRSIGMGHPRALIRRRR